jgi:8-oxo-dGTP pyrophosphatase MutT (NUDIX family)
VPGRQRKGRLPWIADNRSLSHMSAPTTEIIARAVIRRDGYVLLARALSEPWWFLPGGHVEPGEPIQLALIREIAEELGTEARIDGLNRRLHRAGRVSGRPTAPSASVRE